MGDSLALAGVLCTVTGVEESTADGDKRIVEVPVQLASVHNSSSANIRLEEAVSVAVDSLDSGVVGNRDMVRRDADHLAVLLVRVMNGVEAATAPGLQEQPEVGEGSETGGRDVGVPPFFEVRDQVVGGDDGQEKVGGEEIGEHGGCRASRVSTCARRWRSVGMTATAALYLDRTSDTIPTAGGRNRARGGQQSQESQERFTQARDKRIQSRGTSAASAGGIYGRGGGEVAPRSSECREKTSGFPIRTSPPGHLPTPRPS